MATRVSVSVMQLSFDRHPKCCRFVKTSRRLERLKVVSEKSHLIGLKARVFFAKDAPHFYKTEKFSAFLGWIKFHLRCKLYVSSLLQISEKRRWEACWLLDARKNAEKIKVNAFIYSFLREITLFYTAFLIGCLWDILTTQTYSSMTRVYSLLFQNR